MVTKEILKNVSNEGSERSTSAKRNPGNTKESSFLIPTLGGFRFFSEDQADDSHFLFPHLALPMNLCSLSPFYFEAFMFLVSFLVLFIQLCGIYHVMYVSTSEGLTEYYLNFAIVDFYLVGFLVCILSVWLLAHFLSDKNSLSSVVSAQREKDSSSPLLPPLFSRLPYLLSFSIAVLCASHFLRFYSLVQSCCLLCPAAVFASIRLWRKLTRNSVPVVNAHECSLCSYRSRSEVDRLWQEVLDNVCDAAFRSYWICHYACFMPLVFVPRSLFRDPYWPLLFTVVTWITLLLQFLNFRFSPFYIDLLHRASLHLGRWTRFSVKAEEVSESHADDTSFEWCPSTVYVKGSIVKDEMGRFQQAMYSLTTADPANPSHRRFYRFFRRLPRLFQFQTAGVLLFLVFFLCVYFFYARRLHECIGLSMLIVVHLWSVYRVLRNWYVVARLFALEDVVINNYHSRLVQQCSPIVTRRSSSASFESQGSRDMSSQGI